MNMKNKQLLFFILLLISQNLIGANYQKGDSLYVWADSGLKIRSEPSLKGEKMNLIPYGEKVKIIQENLRTIPLKVNELKLKSTNGKVEVFDIEGFWVKVDWNGEEGYVFDGYLSKIETLSIDSLTKATERLMDYLHRISFLRRHVKERLPNSDYIRDSLHFSNGMNIFNASSTGWGTQEFVIPDCTITEGYLIANKLFELKHYGKSDLTEGNYLFNFSKQELLFKWHYGGTEEYSIKKIKNKVIITMHGNC